VQLDIDRSRAMNWNRLLTLGEVNALKAVA